MSNLKNTPWVIEVDPDGTCDIYATDKERESRLRWIAAAIDEPTAKAIAALPETLAELEATKARVKELQEATKASLDQLRSGMCGGAFNTLKQVLEKWKKI